MDNEYNKDGYRIIKSAPLKEKGIQCGLCGMRFDHNKAYGFVCLNGNCPITPPIICMVNT